MIFIHESMIQILE